MVPAEDVDRAVDPLGVLALLDTLGALALCSVSLDGDPGSDGAALEALTSELVTLLESSAEVLGQLEAAASTAREDEYDFPTLEENTWIGAKRPGKVTPRLDDICFAAALELNRARRLLVRANSSSERLVAAEAARRKLHRAAYAALVIGGDERQVALRALKQRFAIELESALIVRRMFARFRRALRRAEDQSAEAVLMALRYAAGALATLTTSTEYGRLRLPDRLLLSQQRDRLLDWSRSGRPVARGLQLLEDIWTCADLLRGINRRQELRRHDEQLIRELLHPTAHGRRDWLFKLEQLIGLNDELDALIARASATSDPELTLDLTLRLACLV